MNQRGPVRAWHKKMLPLLLFLSFGSGIAALVYEIVWFQLLELVVGSTAVSLSILLASFMGGMCLGSLILPRLIASRHRDLRAYACIELGIGVLGILILLLMPFIGGIPFRGLVAAICLLPPTLLMGATLPVLARQAGDVSWLGLLYGANIAGGVFGCLLSGFYLLPKYDVATATYAAVAINFGVAATAFALASVSQGGSRTVAVQNERSRDTAVYLTMALSGLCALGAEAIWTRTLSLLFGASVYAFSIILAVFLGGLGIGSGIGSLVGRLLWRPRVVLAWCQLLLAAAIAWTSYWLSASLPYWPIDPSISSSVRFNFELDLVRAVWALLPPTLLWGASFPVALAAVSQTQDASRLFAGIYAANTLGAIAGALGISLLLVAWLGSQHTGQVLIAISAVAGLLLLPRRWIFALAFGGLGIYSVPPVSKMLIAYGRYAATWTGKSDIVYAREGTNSSVAVATFPNGAVTFHVAGKVQASNVPRDMRLQRMLGHLTTLVPASPRSVLVIGCGAGITAGAVSIDPRVQRETIVEIEPLVPEAAATYFKVPNFDVLHSPKVQVRFDDGRHYLLTSNEKFDGITVDPLDPWVKGAANLYTAEFLAAMRRHLNPGGVVTMYMQLFETNQDAVKSSVATFFNVFPNGTVWGNPYEGKGHDMVLLGQVEPLRIDLDEMEQRVGYRGGDSKIAQSLAEVGMNSPVDLFATYAGRAADLTLWLSGATLNRDRNLRMQYLAGIGLNADDSAAIYAGMLAYRRFPDDLFFSAQGRVDSLREAIRRAQ
jgi:spermidine synthase